MEAVLYEKRAPSQSQPPTCRSPCLAVEVFRLVHKAHPPAADPAEDAVMGNSLANGLGGSSHWLVMLGGVEGEVNCRG
jgi:hypothetical protein